jgi:hypothetical protein
VDITKYVVETVCIIHTCPVLLLIAILSIYETRALKITSAATHVPTPAHLNKGS